MNSLLSVIVLSNSFSKDNFNRLAVCFEKQSYKPFEIIFVLQNNNFSNYASNFINSTNWGTNRIKIIIPEYSFGLGNDRDIGIRSSSGEFVGFVDSDDAFDENLFSNLIVSIISINADAAFCGFVRYKGEKREDVLPKLESESSGKSAAEGLIDGSVDNHLWDKVFRKRVFLNQAFPKFCGGEDFFILPRLCLACSKISILQEPLYSYFVSMESASNAGGFYPTFSMFFIQEDRKTFVSKLLNGYCASAINNDMAKCCPKALFLSLVLSRKEPKFSDVALHIKTFAINDKKEIRHLSNWKTKILFFLSIVFPKIVAFVFYPMINAKEIESAKSFLMYNPFVKELISKT